MFGFQQKILKWFRREDGVAAIEAAMIFPVMLVILLGVFDTGSAILANQKAIRASQVVADLIARNNIVSDLDIAEAIQAGGLAFEPLNSTSYGVDVVSISFDEVANSKIVWRETFNMGSLPDALTAVDALATANDGVLMVTVRYTYTPLFSAFMVGNLDMDEVAFSRGRSTPVIMRETP